MPELADVARKLLPGKTVAAERQQAGLERVTPFGHWPGTVGEIVVLWLPFLAYQAIPGSGKPAAMSWPGTMLLVISLAWSLFVTSHVIANGRWWAWLVVSLLPPVSFAAVPALMLAGALAVRGTAGLGSALLAIAALLVTARQSGLNIRATARPARELAGGQRLIRVIAWNTQYWHQGKDQEEFYAYLRGLDADIYLLQEYLYHVGQWRFRLLDDDERLFAAFAGYEVVVKGELVTASRLPVVGVPALTAENVLRVDIRVTPGGRVLSTYNVHIPVQLPALSPLRREFYQVVRRRAHYRNSHYQCLADDLAANVQPSLVAGDFNASPAVGDLRRLAGVATDAIHANRSIYPVSWDDNRRMLKLWRLDWAFADGGTDVRRYEFLSPSGRSDHQIQSLLVTIPAERPADCVPTDGALEAG
jgi:endonuclease/exonuclease/phosphatase (EEP) superfamily protein YafD